MGSHQRYSNRESADSLPQLAKEASVQVDWLPEPERGMYATPQIRIYSNFRLFQIYNLGAGRYYRISQLK